MFTQDGAAPILEMGALALGCYVLALQAKEALATQNMMMKVNSITLYYFMKNLTIVLHHVNI